MRRVVFLLTVACTLVAMLTLAGPALNPAQAAQSKVEAETMTLSGSSVKVHSSGAASGGKDVAFYSNGSARTTFDGTASKVVLRARGTTCGGPPRLKVYVDGNLKGTVELTNSTFAQHTVALSGLSGGNHTLRVSYPNDYRSSTCDRNAYLDYLVLTQPDSAQSPFAGKKLWVNPNSDARRTADKWRANGRTADAQQMEKIAQAPAHASYFSERTKQYGGAEFHVDAHMDKVVAAGAMPVLGAYAMLNRDCGSYSSGGFTTADEYKAWIDGFARGIGDRKAVVILEPDALAGGSCLTDAQRAERYSLLKYAVYKFTENPKRHVYIDAGHSRWKTTDTTISRLKQSGIERADGFALNTSNFNWTSEEIAYGEKISAGIGGKHFVIDTSRNGNGPYTGAVPHSGDCPHWANLPGRALGKRPTANTGHPLVDAYFWLKQPGESDADCGGYPRAGAWVPEYALGLAQRAAY